MADILNSIIHSSDNAIGGLYNAMSIRRQKEQDTRNAMVQDRNFNEDVKAQAWGRAQSVILGGGTKEQALSVLADASRQYGLPMPAPEVGDLLERSAYGSVASTQSEAPSTVREYEYYNSLTPEGQKQFLLMKRAGNLIDIGGGGKGYLDPGAEAPRQVVAPDQATALDANRAGAITARQELEKTNAIMPRAMPQAVAAGMEAGAKEKATIEQQIAAIPTRTIADIDSAVAKAQTERSTNAQAELPKLKDKADAAISVINDLVNHPGLEYITGVYSLAPIVPGTPQAGADAYMKQIEGQAFLEAFAALKGGGQITQIEGEKATAAILRLSRKQSKSDIQSALKELKGVIEAGLKRAEKSADPVTGLQQNLGEKLNTSVDLPVGTVRRGYIYQGGDPSKQESWKKQ